MLNETFLSDCR